MPSISSFLRRLDRLSPDLSLEGQRRGLIECARLECFQPDELARVEALLADPPSSPGGPETRASIYTDSIMGLLQFLQGRGDPLTERPIACGIDADAVLTDPGEWQVDKIVNLALLRTLQPTKDVAVVAAIRNEGLGLLEWVAYYLTLGVDRIYIYANNNDDGSTPMLEALALHGCIRYIENTNSLRVSPQRKAYEHSINLLTELRAYRWVLYLDADEFLLPLGSDRPNIQDILRHSELARSDTDALLFNWKWFGSENVILRSRGLTIEKYVYSKQDTHVKAMTRLKNTVSMQKLHFPIMVYPDREIRSDLQHRDPSERPKEKSGPVYGIGQINHYWNKSFEEFLIKKSRGRGAVVGGIEQRDYSTFFEWGNNGVRGNLDAMPGTLVSEVKKNIAALSARSDVAAATASIEDHFEIAMEQMYATLDVPEIYRTKGKMSG